MDDVHGRTYSVHGTRAHCARTGWGGAFFRVLGAGGSVMEGDAVRLAARPHPAWSTRRVSELLYGSDAAVMR
jgi:MOSC domain-containing protein YiiM